MRWLFALPLLLGCGEQQREGSFVRCDDTPQLFVADGVAREVECEVAVLQLDFLDDRVCGSVRAPPAGLGDPTVSLTFEGDTHPASFPILWDVPAEPERPPAAARLTWEDDQGLQRAMSGTATFEADASGAVITFEGSVARRDGQERPFTARLETPLIVVCSCAGQPCDDTQRQICDDFRALESWSEAYTVDAEEAR